MAEGLERSVDRLEADDDVWVGILTANTADQERPVFCAGADLKALANGESSMATISGGFAGFTHRSRRKPIIVAVDGLATAGGCEIVLSADLVVATTRSAFGLAEVKRNLLAAAGGLYRLPRAIGRAAAMDAILTGEPITAERGMRSGWCHGSWRLEKRSPRRSDSRSRSSDARRWPCAEPGDRPRGQHAHR